MLICFSSTFQISKNVSIIKRSFTAMSWVRMTNNDQNCKNFTLNALLTHTCVISILFYCWVTDLRSFHGHEFCVWWQMDFWKTSGQKVTCPQMPYETKRWQCCSLLSLREEFNCCLLSGKRLQYLHLNRKRFNTVLAVNVDYIFKD